LDHLTNAFHPECAHSAQCAPFKHHFDECVERVTRQEEDEDYKGPKEDCVEECKSVRYVVAVRADKTVIHVPELGVLT
jgi:Ubiquinol-cytochrome C reductase hinge protein